MSNSSLARLRNDPQVFWAPNEGPITFEMWEPIIVLCGPVQGMMFRKVWYCDALNYLKSAGFDGKVYLPCRLDADLGDYEDEANVNERKNNAEMLKTSDAVIYWQEPTLDVDMLEFTNCFMGAITEVHHIKKSKYVFGCKDKTRLGDLSRFGQAITFSTSLQEVCNLALVKAKDSEKDSVQAFAKLGS